MPNIVNSLTAFINSRGTNLEHPQFQAFSEKSKTHLLAFVQKFSYLPDHEIEGSALLRKARAWKKEAQNKKDHALQYFREQTIINCLVEAFQKYKTSLIEPSDDWVHVDCKIDALDDLELQLLPAVTAPSKPRLEDAQSALLFFISALEKYEQEQIDFLRDFFQDNIICSDKDDLLSQVKPYCQTHVDAWIRLSNFIMHTQQDTRYLPSLMRSVLSAQPHSLESWAQIDPPRIRASGAVSAYSDDDEGFKISEVFSAGLTFLYKTFVEQSPENSPRSRKSSYNS